MANPQLENGYLKLANELAEALARTSFSGYESRCIWLLLRKTYGFNKKSDYISLSQWSEGTLLQRPHVCRTLKQLTERKIITKNGNKWSLNKNWLEWRELPKLVKGGKVTKIGSKVTKNGNASYQSRHIQNKLKQKTINKRKGVTKNGNFEDPHPSTKWITCPHCNTCQNTVKKGKPCPWCGKVV